VRPRPRLLAALLAVLLAALPASAQDAPPAPSPPAPPLSTGDLDRILRRAENNLVLHGLSLDGRFLDRAVGDYRKAVARMPTDAGTGPRLAAHFALAFCIARADFPPEPVARAALAKEAAGALEEAARIDPTVPGRLVVEGMLQEQMGDPRTAVARITAGLEDLEKGPPLAGWQGYQLRLFGLLARCRALLEPGMNREDLALKDAERAERLAEGALLDPDAPRENRLRRVVRTHVAAAQVKLDNFREAERILEALAREDPDNFLHAYNLGLVLAQQQKYPRALEWYRRAADLDPRDPRPHLKVGYILLIHPPPGGEPDAAGAEREAQVYLATTGGKNDEYCALRGEAAWVRGDRKAAERWFTESLAINPACLHSLNRMVQILGSDDRPTPEREKTLREVKERLEKAMEERNRGGGGMGAEKTGLTFCRESGPPVARTG